MPLRALYAQAAVVVAVDSERVVCFLRRICRKPFLLSSVRPRAQPVVVRRRLEVTAAAAISRASEPLSTAIPAVVVRAGMALRAAAAARVAAGQEPVPTQQAMLLLLAETRCSRVPHRAISRTVVAQVVALTDSTRTLAAQAAVAAQPAVAAETKAETRSSQRLVVGLVVA